VARTSTVPFRHGARRGEREIQATAALVTYGWGMIPVEARVGSTDFATSLFAKDGGYVVPLKADVRRAEGINVGDTVIIRLGIAL